MRRRRFAEIAMVAVMAAGFVYGGQDWRHDRDAFYRDDQWHAHVFARVHEDLEHIYTAGAASEKERHRIDRTKDELTALQAKLDQGVWDNGTVNDVIDSLRKSANDERLGPQDRQVLGEDANRIHEFQRDHAKWIHH